MLHTAQNQDNKPILNLTNYTKIRSVYKIYLY